MSGMKRRSKYRKHIESSVLEEYPEPKEDEEVVRVVGSRGGNILEVMTLEKKQAKAETSLCLLPSKYRKLVWVKRGSYLIVSKATNDYETTKGTQGKVKYTVNHILFHKQVKHLIQKGIILEADQALSYLPETERGSTKYEETSGLELEDVPVNRNRMYITNFEGESSSSEEN